MVWCRGAQLIELGVSGKAIDHRVARGLLHVVRRGVDAVGHRVLSREGRWPAAVLADERATVAAQLPTLLADRLSPP